MFAAEEAMLKEEAAMQLKGGKGARDVAAWFADRQQMEFEWRKRLAERISSGEISSVAANRMLSSMGFEPAALSRNATLPSNGNPPTVMLFLKNMRIAPSRK